MKNVCCDKVERLSVKEKINFAYVIVYTDLHCFFVKYQLCTLYVDTMNIFVYFIAI